MLAEWKRNVYAKFYLEDRLKTLTVYRNDAVYTWWRDYLDEQIEKTVNELKELNKG